MPPRRRLPVSRAALAVIMLPVEILREILRYLDTKLIVMQDDVDWDRGHWAGTRRMQNRARLRRRVGQTGYVATPEIYGILDIITPGPFNY